MHQRIVEKARDAVATTKAPDMLTMVEGANEVLRQVIAKQLVERHRI